MKLTYLGQSCIQLDVKGKKILVDPFISNNPLAKDVDIDSILPDYIFLSHAHEDHVLDMARIQKNSDAEVMAIVETAAWVRKQGVPDEKVTEFNFGGTLDLPFGKVKMVYALHTSSTPDGEYGGVPAGFVFFLDGLTLYVAGDTALTMEMKLLSKYKLDYAILPIGGHYTMDVDDAIEAAQHLDCDKVIGVHYDTFPPIKIDKEEAKLKFESANKMLLLPSIGSNVDL